MVCRQLACPIEIYSTEDQQIVQAEIRSDYCRSNSNTRAHVRVLKQDERI